MEFDLNRLLELSESEGVSCNCPSLHFSDTTEVNFYIFLKNSCHINCVCVCVGGGGRGVPGTLFRRSDKRPVHILVEKSGKG